MNKQASDEVYVTREALEQLANEAIVVPTTDVMEMISQISERVGLQQESKLELRRVVMAKLANREKSFEVGQQMQHKGELVTIHKLEGTAAVPVDMALVQNSSGEEQMVYLADLTSYEEDKKEQEEDKDVKGSVKYKGQQLKVIAFDTRRNTVGFYTQITRPDGTIHEVKARSYMGFRDQVEAIAAGKAAVNIDLEQQAEATKKEV